MEKAIICVDDEILILESLKSQLISEFGSNFIFEFAESGEEGIQILEDLSQENIKIVAIISDWLMPKMKGDEFLAIVRKKDPEIIAVMLSGYADKHIVSETKTEACLYKFIPKPWDKKDLFSAIYDGLNIENEGKRN